MSIFYNWVWKNKYKPWYYFLKFIRIIVGFNLQTITFDEIDHIHIHQYIFLSIFIYLAKFLYIKSITIKKI